MSESKKVEKEEIIEKPAKAEKPVEKITKAGKNSAKSKAEAAEKEAKEIKKSKKSTELSEDKPKVVQKPRVIKYSKNQKAARELLEKGKLYTIKEAIELLPKLSKTKFDATAEVHISLDIDPRQADQNLRTSVALPAGSGKTVKVAVIAGEKESLAAKKAGADNTDSEQIISQLNKGKFDFDVLIATPEKMPALGKFAKVLGPKGLMPSPKSGTVTADPAAMVDEIKKGRAEIKNDAQGIVHVAFGKLSFKQDDLENNLVAVMKAVKANKPAGVKGVYVKTIFVTSTMSPSVKISTSEL